MGGGAMLPPVTAAAGGATYTRSTSFPANFHSHQSLPVIPKASSQSTGVAEPCSENLPYFDVDDNCFEGRQSIAARKPYFDLGPVPTRMEAEKAMADLQRFIQSETNSDMKRIPSMVSSSESRMLQSAGYGRGGLPDHFDALNMLQKDPSMQSMVISISCDKAVWDAILSNTAVQDLRGSLSAAREKKMQTSREELDRGSVYAARKEKIQSFSGIPSTVDKRVDQDLRGSLSGARKEKIQSFSEKPNTVDKRVDQDLRGSLSGAREAKIQSSSERLDMVDFILKYLTGITKSKVVELIEKLGALLGALVAEIFKPANKAKPTSDLSDLLEEKIRSSLLLTIVILLIVIVTRDM